MTKHHSSVDARDRSAVPVCDLTLFAIQKEIDELECLVRTRPDDVTTRVVGRLQRLRRGRDEITAERGRVDRVKEEAERQGV